jgi:hypothetical protein
MTKQTIADMEIGITGRRVLERTKPSSRIGDKHAD